MSGDFELDGRHAEWEVISVQLDNGDTVEWGDVDETVEGLGAEVDRVDFWYEFEDGTREYRTVHGPFSSEGDIEQAVIDGIEFDPSP